ncbi:MAG TPA: helix-turn-helix transcriptional regulator [Chitinophagaceae bacterium]|nr:helix-turn-helix transcriptional regulator [Chitinophagaceae bacterium]
MSQFFRTITEENKLSLNKPVDSDVVYYSELNEWFTMNAFRSFSLKYVVDKCIYYKIGNKEFPISSGNLLLACKQPHVRAYFDSTSIVKSICIDICPDTVSEAFTILTAKKDHAFDNYLAGYFQHPVFFESVAPASSTQFRDKLNQLIHSINKGEAEELINREWFLDLIEKIIFHEYGNYVALNSISSVKWSTRKELLQRLQVARQYMNDSFLQVNEIAEVASVCNLSEFHFYRSFKEAFGITPYQYLLNCRLNLAKELIKQNNQSLSSIALVCNFPDLFTFSKAFKRHFGISPSGYLMTL